MALNTFKCNCLTPLHFKWLTASGVAKGAVGGGRPPQSLIRNFWACFLHRAVTLTDAGMCKTFLGCLCRSSSVLRVIFIVVACAGRHAGRQQWQHLVSAMSSGVPAVWQAAAALLGWGETILMLLRRVPVLLAVADRRGMWVNRQIIATTLLRDVGDDEFRDGCMSLQNPPTLKLVITDFTFSK